MKSNTLSWQDKNQKNKILAILNEKKVILAPSDTVFGLCGVASLDVFDELNKLKGRQEKPFLLLAASLRSIENYAVIPKTLEIKKILKAFWPGPLTVVFKALPAAPGYLVSHAGTIAFRIPDNEFLQELLKIHPLLFSTSANKTGKPVPELLDAVDEHIKQEVAAIVIDAMQDQTQSTIPSTIIDATKNEIILVREGAISWQAIQKYAQLKVE